MNRIKKAIITTVVALTTVATLAPMTAGAVTVAELQAQIQALLSQLQTLQGAASGIPASCAGITFTRNLTVGSTGSDVKCLQASMNVLGYSVASSGAGSPGFETMYFGPLTLVAVQKYQAAKGWTPAGQVGPLTRASLNAWLSGGASVPTTAPTPGCPTGAMFNSMTGAPCTTTTPAGPLTGGAGDITVANLSTYSSTNVGEGSNNVKVVAFTVEADSSSDVAITSMKVQAYQRTAADDRDIKKYVKDVSLWMDSTEIGRATASEFSDSSTTNLWEKTIATSAAVVKKSEKKTFYVAVSANNSIDSSDSDTDDWQISISSIRFLDGSGVTTTQAQTTDVTTDALTGVEQTFNFATSLSANAVELKVALKDTDKTINKAHLVNVKSGTADNDGVEILSFTLEAKGSDIKVEEFPVVLTTSGDATESNLIKTAHLWRGSTKLGSETVADGGAVTFDNLDFVVTSGSKDSFKITIDVQDLTGNLDEGDEAKAEMTAGVLDGGIIARDNTNERLTSAEISGAALGEFAVFRDIGFTLALVSTSAVLDHAGDIANTSDHDRGLFKIVFDVTAWDGDIYIDATAPDSAGGATESDLDYTGSPTETSGSIVCTSGSCEAQTTVSLKVTQGDTGRITITRALTAASDALVDVALKDLMWNLTNADADLNFTYNLTDYKTPQFFLNLDQS